MITENIKALIIDMDGVVWRSDAPIGDLPRIFDRIRERGLKFTFATNNGTKTPEEYAERLLGFGVKVETEQIITSARALAHMLGQKFPRGTKIFMIGENGIRVALEEKGYEILSVEDAPQAEAVVFGIDRTINFQKVAEATLLINSGVPFYATNSDRTFPIPRGEIPGAGSWLAVLTSATNIQPTIAGKPFPFMMDFALEQMGTSKADTLVVGDRLETDIASGQSAGFPTALVLSGVTTPSMAAEWSPSPDIIADDLWSLVK